MKSNKILIIGGGVIGLGIGWQLGESRCRCYYL